MAILTLAGIYNGKYILKRVLPFCFLDILAPTKLGVQPVEFEVELGCEGLHYLRLHSALKDKNQD